jgi:hypothetical protein
MFKRLGLALTAGLLALALGAGVALAATVQDPGKACTHANERSRGASGAAIANAGAHGGNVACSPTDPGDPGQNPGPPGGGVNPGPPGTGTNPGPPQGKRSNPRPPGN